MTDLGLNKTRVCQKGKIKNQKTPFFDTPLFFKAYAQAPLRLISKHR